MRQAQEKKYFRVGLVAIIAICLILVAFCTVFSPNFFRPKTIVETYFKESINGLSVGAPVKFHGVKIGEVKEILLSSAAYPEHHINLFSKDKSVAVVRMTLFLDGLQLEKQLPDLSQKGLRIQTELAGVTGTLFLNASYLNPNLYPPEVPKYPWTPHHPYIPSAISLTNEILDNLENFFSTLKTLKIDLTSGVSEGKTSLAHDLNLKSSLEQLNAVVESIKPEDIRGALSEAEKLIQTSSGSLAKIDVQKINEALAQLKISVEAVNQTLKSPQATNLVKDLEKMTSDLNSIVTNNNYDVRALIMSLQSITTNLSRTATDWANSLSSQNASASSPLRTH